MGVPGHGVEGLPTVRRLLRSRCIEHAKSSSVLGRYVRRGKQSELAYRDKLRSQMAEKVIVYAGPLEDL